MRQLSPAGRKVIDDLARRHGFGPDAVMSMLESIIQGNGCMAQFSHPEFGGSGQWMRGGMTMLSDMFNNVLKGRVEALCTELSSLVSAQPDLLRSGSFQSQRQGALQHEEATGAVPEDAKRRKGRRDAGMPGAAASLFVPPAPGSSGDWWPAGLGRPTSSGAQDGVRYAYFAEARRLAIEVHGVVTVYDTLDHRIGGFAQQQSRGGSLSFASQHGLVDVASLPIVSANGVPPPSATPPAPSQAAPTDVFASIEKLAALRAKGLVSEEEFAAKKAELLGRL